MIRFNKSLNIALLILFLWPGLVSASLLYLDPADGTYGPGDNFAVNIKLELDSDCVNTIEGLVAFPNDYLNVLDFITGDSFLNLWIKKPAITDLAEVNNKGILQFAGGIPGGYCGRIPGDPGESNIVGKIIFQIPSLIISDIERDELVIDILNTSRVLLNDGQGTEDNLVTRGAVINFSSQPVRTKEDWRDIISSDTIPPEPFVIELRQDDRIFNGQYYVIFSTTDKQTGVDHFEILEIRSEEKIGAKPKIGFFERFFVRKRLAPEWKEAKMPYLLEDQTLQSVIKIKALDKAGNERIVEYIPPKTTQIVPTTPLKSLIIMISLIVIIIGIIIIGIIFAVKRFRTKFDDQNEEE